jgi:hypothetical protein
MMTYVELVGLEHIVSWIHNGRGFMVHNPGKMVEILPLFFSQTQYRSFSRQLNMWHFERILDGHCKGAFVHPYFLKGQKLLCGKMSRHDKLPLSSYPVESKQLEAPWHFTNEFGDDSPVIYPSKTARSSPSSSSFSAAIVHTSCFFSDELVDSDHRIRAKNGEEREFRDGALTDFAGRKFFFLAIDDDSPSTEKVIPRLLQIQEESQRTGSQDAFSDMLRGNIFLAQTA